MMPNRKPYAIYFRGAWRLAQAGDASARALLFWVAVMCVPACYANRPVAPGTDETLQMPQPNPEVPPTPTTPATPVSPVTPPATPTVAPDCATAGLTVCDDFETEKPGAAPNAKLWTLHKENANERIEIDATRAIRGRQSVHFHTTNQGYEHAVMTNTSAFPAAQNTIFARMFMYFAGPVPKKHFDLVSAAGKLPGQSVETSLNYGGQEKIFLANYYNQADPKAILDLWQHAGVQQGGVWTDQTLFPADKWVCLEFEFKGETNETLMWLDGRAIDRMHLNARSTDCCADITWTAPPYSALSMGWTIVANDEPFDHFDMWLDGVALDGKRIGCDK